MSDANIIRAMERTCPGCGHDLTPDGCANCLRRKLDGVYRYTLRLRWSEQPFDNNNVSAILGLSAPNASKPTSEPAASSPWITPVLTLQQIEALFHCVDVIDPQDLEQEFTDNGRSLKEAAKILSDAIYTLEAEPSPESGGLNAAAGWAFPKY